MARKCYANTIISKAKKEIGTVEKPVNKVKYNTWFYGRKVSGDAYPWCMAFQSWLFHKAGRLDLIGGKSASCAQTVDWFKDHNQWHSTPKVGDLVFFTFSHVELVIEVHDGYVTTIGGNTSPNDGGSQRNGGGVYKRTRSSSILGYGTPAYDKKPVTVTKLVSRIYKKCNVKSGIAKKVPKGTKIAFKEDCGNGWSKVAVGSVEGFMKNSAIKKTGLSAYKKVGVTAKCPLRAKNKKDSKILCYIPADAQVSLVGKGKVWANVKYNGKDGFVFHTKIKE